MNPLKQSCVPLDPIALDALIKRVAKRAKSTDHYGARLLDDLADLASTGVLIWPLPTAYGGASLAGDPARSEDLFRLLRRIGQANLSLGRLYEGHVNSIKLMATYASSSQQAEFAVAVCAGASSGVWNADPPEAATIEHTTAGTFILRGRKIFASGAGMLTRPMITAASAKGPLLVVLAGSEISRTDTTAWRPLGMRATATGSVDLDGLEVREDQIIGVADDYLRDPDYHGGAWRYLAVQLGGMEAIVTAAAALLRDRARDSDSLQRARFGRIGIALHTARLLAHDARLAAMPCRFSSANLIPKIDMARLAVERAGMSIIDDVTQSIGLTACLEEFEIERMMRDLITYLRQPGPDNALLRAGIETLGEDRCFDC